MFFFGKDVFLKPPLYVHSVNYSPVQRYVLEQEGEDCLIHGFQGRNHSNPFRLIFSLSLSYHFILRILVERI